MLKGGREGLVGRQAREKGRGGCGKRIKEEGGGGGGGGRAACRATSERGEMSGEERRGVKGR